MMNHFAKLSIFFFFRRVVLELWKQLVWVCEKLKWLESYGSCPREWGIDFSSKTKELKTEKCARVGLWGGRGTKKGAFRVSRLWLQSLFGKFESWLPPSPLSPTPTGFLKLWNKWKDVEFCWFGWGPFPHQFFPVWSIKSWDFLQQQQIKRRFFSYCSDYYR